MIPPAFPDPSRLAVVNSYQFEAVPAFRLRDNCGLNVPMPDEMQIYRLKRADLELLDEWPHSPVWEWQLADADFSEYIPLDVPAITVSRPSAFAKITNLEV